MRSAFNKRSDLPADEGSQAQRTQHLAPSSFSLTGGQYFKFTQADKK